MIRGIDYREFMKIRHSFHSSIVSHRIQTDNNSRFSVTMINSRSIFYPSLLIIIYLVISLVVVQDCEGAYLDKPLSLKLGYREKVWCHRHADCVSLNYRWCCVPFGDRKIAVNGVRYFKFLVIMIERNVTLNFPSS